MLILRRGRRGSSGRAREIGRWLPTLFLLCVLQALQGCGSLVRDPEVVVLASGSDLESGNPVITVHTMSRQMQRHMLFTPLIALDSALRPVPRLASAWHWNDRRDELTLVLRTDVLWHDGVPTTARDVAFTIAAARDPATGSPRASDFASVERVEVVSDSVLRIHFLVPQLDVPLVLAELPPVPEHLLRDVPYGMWRQHAFATAPTGNGPFIFVSREAGVRWRFRRNEQFPMALGGPPRMREVVIAVVDEPATKFAGLVGGELDVAGVSPSMAGLVSRDPLLMLESPPVLFSTMLAFNCTAPPFDDVRVRRAISLAINRQRIVDAAVAGFAYPTLSAIPPGVFGAGMESDLLPPGRATSDLAAAAALLDSAGWNRTPSGARARGATRLSLTLLTVGTGDLAVEQLLQSDLLQLGIALEIRSVELASFLDQLRAPRKQFDLAYTGVPGDLALSHLQALFHSAQRGGALDYTGYHTPLLDSLLDVARTEGDAPARRASWERVAQQLEDNAPVAFVYHARGVQGRSRSLGGVVMDLRGELVTIADWYRTP